MTKQDFSSFSAAPAGVRPVRSADHDRYLAGLGLSDPVAVAVSDPVRKVTKTPDRTGRGYRRHGRYASKRKAALLLQEVLPKAAKRLSCCGYSGFGADVQLCSVPSKDTVFLTGVSHCGSVWLCPNCTMRINARRKLELDVLLAAARSAGKSVHMLTLTFQHTASDDLVGKLGDLKRALEAFRNCRGWRDLSVHGAVTATEVTHGFNGFHPHFHLLILMDEGAAEAAELLESLRADWIRCLGRFGLTGNEHAFHVQDGSAAGQYVAKFGAAEEMTLKAAKKGRKGSRSPWQLLDDARDGDVEAGKLWAEYAVAFKGKRQLVWSKGLKALYQIEEVSDAEAAEAEAEQGEVIVLRTWTASGSWPEARRRLCAIFQAAETGGDLDAAEAGPTDAQRWRDDEWRRSMELEMEVTE